MRVRATPGVSHHIPPGGGTSELGIVDGLHAMHFRCRLHDLCVLTDFDWI